MHQTRKVCILPGILMAGVQIPIRSARSKRAEGNGMWKKTLCLEPGVYEYRFVVDGIWHDDAGSVEGWTNEFGSFNCVIWI
jgi:hypothetical protein